MAIALQSTNGGVYSAVATSGTGTITLSGITQDADVSRVFLIVAQEGTAPTHSSPAYDGVTPSLVGSGFADDSFDLRISVYQVLEADLPAAGSGKSASINVGGTNDGLSIGVILLTGTGSDAVDGLNASATLTDGDVNQNVSSSAEGSAIIFASGSGNGGAVSGNRTLLYERENINTTTTHHVQIQLNAGVGSHNQAIDFATNPNRTAWVGFAIRPAAPVVEIDSASFAAGSATMAATAEVEAFPVAFVSAAEGGVPRDVTVASGTTLLVVATLNNAAFAGTRVVFYGGTPMQLAHAHNDWVQVNYMIDPPVGTAQLTIDDTTNAGTAVEAHYQGIAGFQSGQTASLGQDTYDPDGAGLVVHAVVAASTAHTPAAGTNERLDSAGDWFGDRIIAAAGSVTVGVTDATDPDYAGAIFLLEANDPDHTIGVASFQAGAATMAATATRVREADAAAFVSGAAAMTAAALRVHPATAAFAAQGASSAGAAARVREGSAAFAAGSAAASTTAARVRAALAAFEAAASALATSAARAREASATFTAGPGAASASAVLTHTAQAAFTAQGAALEASAARVRGAAGVFAAGPGAAQAEGELVHPAQAAFAAGSASLDGSAARVREASGAFEAAPAAFSAFATIAGSLTATAAFAAGPAAFSAGAALVRQADAAFQSGAASLEAMAARVRQASAEFSAGSAALESGAERVLPAAATFEAAPASWQGEAVRALPAAAAFESGPAAFAATAEIDGAITATAQFQAASAVLAAALARVLPASAAFAAGDASFSAALGSPESPGTGVRALGQGTMRIAHGSGDLRAGALGAGLGSVRRPTGRMAITAAQGRQSASWQS